jgi:hypothetical protein
VRGFLSTAAKKHGLKIESTKTEVGDRVLPDPKVGFKIEAATCEGGGFFSCTIQR